MPLFEYFCLDCKEVREVLLPLKDYKQKIPCPKCKKHMKKRIGKVHLSSNRCTFGY